MKSKLLKRTLVIILFLGVISLAGWFYIKYKPEVDSPVPKYVDSIFCLDVINLRNELIKGYLSGDDLKDPRLIDIREIGLRIPNYALGFTCLDLNPNTMFSSFEIVDTTLYNSWEDSLIKSHHFLPITDSKYKHLLSPSNRVVLTVDSHKERVLVSFGFKVEVAEIEKVCSSIFNGIDIMDEEDERMVRIRKNKNLGFIWLDQGRRLSKESRLVLAEEGGQFSLTGNLYCRPHYQFPISNEFMFNSEEEDNLMGMNFNTSKYLEELFSIVNPVKFEKLLGVRLDSIRQYNLNKIELSLYEPTVETDTIIKYEYDDNFNKVEKKEIHSQVSPSFNLFISSENKGIYQYLLADSSIKLINETSVFTAFPFSRVYAKEISTYLNLTTNQSYQITTPIQTSDFLIANIHFNKLDSNYLNFLPFDKGWIENKIIKMKGTQRGDTTLIKLTIAD